MDFNELLKEFLEEDKIASLLEKMKANKIFTAGAENMDIRYKDLQDKFNSKETELGEANKLIKSLQESNKGNEDLQGQINTYNEQVAQLQAENEQLKIDNAIKVGLLSAKANPDDLDYLMFKIKQNKEDLKLDDNGELKGIDFTEVKTMYPNNFTVESKKEVDINKLPKIEDNNVSVTQEQFNKMSYKEKNELFMNDPDTYKKLNK